HAESHGQRAILRPRLGKVDTARQLVDPLVAVACSHIARHFFCAMGREHAVLGTKTRAMGGSAGHCGACRDAGVLEPSAYTTEWPTRWFGARIQTDQFNQWMVLDSVFGANCPLFCLGKPAWVDGKNCHVRSLARVRRLDGDDGYGDALLVVFGLGIA